MDCPTEERLIRQTIEPMAGVVQLDFNLLDRELTIHHRLNDTGALELALTELGMAPRLLEAGARPTPLPPALPLRTKLALGAAGLCAAGAEGMAWATGHEGGAPVVVLALLSLALAGLPTLRKGWIALRHFTLNIYFLMTLAVAGAMVIGQWGEAAMVVFLFALAEAIEALSLERARKAVQSLAAYAPDTAWVKSSSSAAGHGHDHSHAVADDWTLTPAADVQAGQTIRVRAGERVPLDARVVSGQAAVDQSPITGESLPVDKRAGDVLYAGTVVSDGLLEALVTATAARSTMARMADAIQQAQSQRAPTQRFVDRFARVYTPAVVLLAVSVAVLGPVVTGDPWQSWLYQALVMLVIACPCALVVSTPVTVVSGLAAAARQGILIKGGVFLEGGRLIRAVALDKTGTLTQGRPMLSDVVGRPGTPVDEVLRLAASLDAQSTHPVARAVVAAWRSQPHAAQQPLWRVEAFKNLPGQGVIAVVHTDAGPRQVALGNLGLLSARGLADATTQAQMTELADQGKTVFALMDDHAVLGVLAVSDALRPDSREAVVQLQALGVTPVMLTGDNVQTARHIAAQLGIKDARGPLMPEDKLRAVESLQSTHGPVAMVGDGVNDGPALARADIGLAMGAAGTATALETADVAIMDDDPRKIARFIRLSQATHRMLVQNIALALGIKAVFLGLSLAGLATLWMAVFADVGASLLVVANGMRLLREARR
ncbi:MAG: heavy metal translocating P-type ATPase [Aquabacterium sp.]